MIDALPIPIPWFTANTGPILYRQYRPPTARFVNSVSYPLNEKNETADWWCDTYQARWKPKLRILWAVIRFPQYKWISLHRIVLRLEEIPIQNGTANQHQTLQDFCSSLILYSLNLTNANRYLLIFWSQCLMMSKKNRPRANIPMQKIYYGTLVMR